MTKELIESSVEQYLKTLAEHGRVISENISPKQDIIDNEAKFLHYLDGDDLFCMFCGEHLVVIVIDYKTQRPVWGCLKDKFTKGMQKIKWLGHCADCGRKLKDQTEEDIKYQKQHLEQDNVLSVCEKCIGNGNILNDEDMKDVHKKKPLN